jgi:hypothetical protein
VQDRCSFTLGFVTFALGRAGHGVPIHGIDAIDSPLTVWGVYEPCMPGRIDATFTPTLWEGDLWPCMPSMEAAT